MNRSGTIAELRDGPVAMALVFERARTLARLGRYREAIEVVGTCSELQDSREGRELVAKIATLQGDHPRALELWQALADDNPADASARRMVEAIEVWKARPWWTSWALFGVATLLVASTVVAVVLVMRPRTPPRVYPPPAVVPVAPKSTQPPSETPVIRFVLPEPSTTKNPN
jgi:hypothetical protein